MENIHHKKRELANSLTEKSVRRGLFTLSSGATSELYIDAKLTTSDPRSSLLIGSVAWDAIKEISRDLGVEIDGVGGLTMGADWISLSIGVAAQLDEISRSNLRVFSVRKETKKHGGRKLIEGNFVSGDLVVVIEDVITTGASAIKAIEAVENSGGKVAFVLALVDRQEDGIEAIEKLGKRVVSIFIPNDLFIS